MEINDGDKVKVVSGTGATEQFIGAIGVIDSINAYGECHINLDDGRSCTLDKECLKFVK